MTHFVLPRGITGFNIDDPPGQRTQLREGFVAWCRAHAEATAGRAVPVETDGNFDVVSIAKQNVWLLQNRFLPIVGVVDRPPKAGFAFAVEGDFIDLPPGPAHLTDWGPTLLPSNILNRELTNDDWEQFSPPAQQHADRFKPTQVGHVLFNYWE